jgi:hypothetical protein
MPSPVGVNVTDSSQIGNAKGIATMLIVVAIVVLVFIFADKIIKFINGFLEDIGLKDDPTKKKNKEQTQAQLEAESAKGVMSAWSPSFYKNAPGGSALITVATADDLASDMYGSVGYLYDTPSVGEGVIKQLSTKTQVSFLADRFYINYKVDLLSWLKQHYDTGDQVQHLATMLDYVKALPDYNKS